MSQVVVSTFTNSLATKLAGRFGMDANPEIIDVLKKTAFKGEVSDAQMGALLVVANQYGLNPWVKEIYAFPDKGSIIPVVGVDGWARIVNDHPQYDGVEFEFDAEGLSCTCSIYRKDRSHPTRTTEYLAECKRDTGPWKSHPRRMLRHKAFMQCGRLAFGFTGIYDQDEAERIAEVDMGRADVVRRTPTETAEAARTVVAMSEHQQQLLDDLRIVAREQGMAALQEIWAGLDKKDRTAIGGDNLARLKEMASAETVDDTAQEE